MHNALLIARREYLERIRSRAFRIATVLVPLAFGVVFAAIYLSSQGSNAAQRLVVASNDAGLAQSIAADLRRQSVEENGADSAAGLESRTVQPQALSALDRRIQTKQIDSYLWVQIQTDARRPAATIFASRSSAPPESLAPLRAAIGRALLRRQLRDRGLTDNRISELLEDVNISTVRIKDGTRQASDSGKSFWGAYVMAFCLYLSVLFYGVNVAHSIASEKSSRVFEVLLATVKPGSLLAGKLIGVGGAGLTQLLIWVLSVLLFSSSTLAAHFVEGGLSAYGITPVQLLFLLAYFILGFFLYSSISACVGATVGQESEVQQFNILIALPQMVGLILMMYIFANPSSWPAVLLSLAPPFAPIVMCLRMSATIVPWWQVALSIALMAASIGGTVWAAARIYRIGILMYGKRATLPEVLRWVRCG